MVALAIAQAVIALRGHALVALGWGVGVVTFVARHLAAAPTSCSGGSSSAWWRRRSPRWCAFAVALRAKLRSGARAVRAIGDGRDHRHAARDLTGSAARSAPAGLLGLDLAGRWRPSS